MIDKLSSELIDGLPSLKQKFLVDLVNGIDVNRDHVKTQKDHEAFIPRLCAFFTGSDYRRQNQINGNIIEGLESSFKWLNKLTEEMAFSNKSLIEINDGLLRVKNDLSKVATFAADTKEQLNELQHIVDQRFTEFELQIQRVDMRQRAYQQMDSLFVSWSAGNFSALSLAQRCFLVISELSWGKFGDYCQIAFKQDRESLLKHLRDRLVAQIRQDASVSQDSRISTDFWLQANIAHSNLAEQYQHAVSYLGNNIDAQQQAFTWFVLNTNEKRPEVMPYIMDATRLVKGLSNDLLGEDFVYANQ